MGGKKDYQERERSSYFLSPGKGKEELGTKVDEGKSKGVLSFSSGTTQKGKEVSGRSCLRTREGKAVILGALVGGEKETLRYSTQEEKSERSTISSGRGMWGQEKRKRLGSSFFAFS